MASAAPKQGRKRKKNPAPRDPDLLPPFAVDEPIPRFVLDLDRDPKERWRPICRAFRERFHRLLQRNMEVREGLMAYSWRVEGQQQDGVVVSVLADSTKAASKPGSASVHTTSCACDRVTLVLQCSMQLIAWRTGHAHALAAHARQA
jgi:hypothetical protein